MSNIENVPLGPVYEKHVWQKAPFEGLEALEVSQSFLITTRMRRSTVQVILHRAGRALKRRFGMRKEGKGFRIGRLE